MRLLARLAWRNLGRSRRRTALMVAVVALSTWAIVVMWGLTDGFTRTTIDAQLQLDTGDLQVHRAGYLADRDLSSALDVDQLGAIRDHLDRTEAVEAASARIDANGLLKSAYGSTGVAIRGVELPNEADVTDIVASLTDGGFLSGEHQIVLGAPLARDLDVRLGERVVLETQGTERQESRAFRLVGTIETGMSTLDRRTAFIPLDDARALTGLSGATTVAVALAPGASAEAVAADLEERLGQGLAASTLFDLNPLLGNMVKIGTFEMMPTMIVLSLLAGFGVANTVMFTVLERTREFGVLTAVGLKPRRLALLILMESILASLVGFAIGGVAGYGVNAYLARFGIDLSFYPESFSGPIGMPHVLYAETSGWYWLYGLSVVILTALVAAWYPARRATKLEPTEAMRHV
mgnify:CR=1 FL=1